MPKDLNNENFDQEIKNTDKIVVIDFYATWCEPCSMLAPILEKLEKEFSKNIALFKANVDENQVNAQKYQVDKIPMVVFLKNDKPISFFNGFVPEENLRDFFKKIIEENK